MRPEGSVQKEGLESLIKHINTYSSTKDMTVIEIGSYIGESTTIFAKHFKKVIAIDPFINDYDPNDICVKWYADFEDSVYNKFLETIQGYDNIEFIRKTSDDAFLDLKDQSVDFIYIDGMHTYEQCLKDITNYRQITKAGGFVGGHDYVNKDCMGVTQAINESFDEIDRHFPDLSWVKRV
jgi:cephalosporin hydroxylase